jgi:HK97 family phage portal protein
MKVAIAGYELRLSKAPAGLSPVRSSRGFWPTVRESYSGAWQHNVELSGDTAIRNPTIFSCATLIAETIGKCQLRLVEQVDPDVWVPTSNPAYTPVLRKPNRYQTIQKFLEAWLSSKLLHGNAFILKQRDQRGVVIALYPLDPAKVTPLIAPDGAIYYEIQRHELAGLTTEQSGADRFVVPAREVIHDLMVPLFHPLVGVSPIYACATAALQAISIQDSSASFFANGARPSGVLTVPAAIEQEDADALAASWYAKHSGINTGKIAIVTGGVTYAPAGASAVDSQLVEQLKWSTETICGCFKVPAALIDSSHAAPYGNSEQLVQQYYSQCLQALMTAIELSLDEGLDLYPLGTEFNVDDLYWMDTATRTKAAGDAIGSATLTPNEARRKYFGYGPLTGGDTAYMQQQNYSLAALAARDRTNPLSQPSATVRPAVPPPPDDEDDLVDEEEAVTR